MTIRCGNCGRYLAPADVRTVVFHMQRIFKRGNPVAGPYHFPDDMPCGPVRVV